jgi:phosphoribosylamine--glycine ligase
MASGGYPNEYEKNNEIINLPSEENNLKVFHAGTYLKEGNILTSGGRVLCVTALGSNTIKAQKKAYRSVSKIKWKDCFNRSDIGYRAIKREKNG